MKQLFSTLVFGLLLNGSTFAQNNSGHYWVTLKDKAHSDFSLDRPQQFLSDKSIERRKKQQVQLTENDLPVSSYYTQQIQQQGAIVVHTSRWFNAVSITADAAVVARIRKLSFVRNCVALDTPLKSALVQDKFDMEQQRSGPLPQKAAVTSDYYDYGLAWNQANMIGIDCMHNMGFRGQGMTIAVLDAGFYNVDVLPAFDSLRLKNHLLGCRDFVTGDTLVFEDYPHGMNVLSCMVGNLPGRLVGTAPEASFWLLRTEDVGSETLQEEVNWAIAAEFADSVGADVINSSLGYSTFDNPADNHTYADMDGNTTIITKAADYAASKGIFVTSSAGNAGGPPWYKITAPADADSVLTVGAIDSAGFIASFSSRGPTFDGRIKPNTVAKGVDAVFASPMGDITTGGGTSFSSPITAGAVACLWQANPGRTNMEILAAIEQSASQATMPDTIKGYGIPNFCQANALLTGISENEKTNSVLLVYPNPFTSDFTCSFYSNSSESCRVELFTTLGELIYSREIKITAGERNQFGVGTGTDLPKGVYILKIQSKQTNYVTQIIKK